MKSLLRGLVGIWRGEGAGSYPDVPAFRYLEVRTPEYRQHLEARLVRA